MSSTYEFASPQWLACMHGIMATKAAQAADQLAGANFSMCEVFTDVPTSVHPDGRAAWHCRIKDGTFIWALGEADDVQRKIVGDYETIKPLAQTVFSEDPAQAAEAQQSMMKAHSEGKITVTGDFAGAPAVFAGVHDEIARLTS